MNENSSWIGMVLMAFVLGLRHGLDLDHLSTIDAITRTVRDSRYLSKMTAILFSMGHGLVVTLISLLIGSGIIGAHTPNALEGFGKWIFIFFLISFGLLNLWSLFQTKSTEPPGIVGMLTKKLFRDKIKFSPILIMCIGALFALSFDTFSQIALFSLSGSLMSGWTFSGILGLFFTFGMLVSDGLNGLFVSTLIQNADGASLVLSRSLGFAISLFSLITAMLILLSLLAQV